MNERIEQLAEQATIQEGSHGAFGEPTINEYVDLEKFAELIVRECDAFVAERYDEMEPWMEPGDLLKHFGVE
jgi:hypothetical protein